MRRRIHLAWAGWLLAIQPAAAEPLTLDVRRIENFRLTGAETDAPLTFLGGLDVSSPDWNFGGVSGIRVADDGAAVSMITDSGSFVRARLVHEAGRLAGIVGEEIVSLYADGDTGKSAGDTEDIAFDPSDPTEGVVVRERQANAMLRFELDGGRPARFSPVTVGAEDRILRSNKGLESVDFAPPGSPWAGQVIAIAERTPRGRDAIPGWITGAGAFEVAPRDDFDVSSARFLPDGDLLLLERRYSPAWGIAMRLRRIAGGDIAPGALLDGETLIEANMTSQIDNMEGLAVHQDAAGRTILTLVSDDNFSILQRTLILQFALGDD